MRGFHHSRGAARRLDGVAGLVREHLEACEQDGVGPFLENPAHLRVHLALEVVVVVAERVLDRLLLAMAQQEDVEARGVRLVQPRDELAGFVLREHVALAVAEVLDVLDVRLVRLADHFGVEHRLKPVQRVDHERLVPALVCRESVHEVENVLPLFGRVVRHVLELWADETVLPADEYGGGHLCAGG